MQVCYRISQDTVCRVSFLCLAAGEEASFFFWISTNAAVTNHLLSCSPKPQVIFGKKKLHLLFEINMCLHALMMCFNPDYMSKDLKMC